jgi:hypothetical protein
MSRIRYLDIDELNDRLSELEDLELNVSSAQDDLDDANADISDEDREELETALSAAQLNFTEADIEELKKLRDLKDEIGERGGKISEDNGPFIDEADFTAYAQQMAEEVGDIDRNVRWPYTCIDWDCAAKELKYDYTSVDWEGTTYYYLA